jgi:hypothetical protein
MEEKLDFITLPPMLGGAMATTYKGVRATVAFGDDWVSIYSIWSINERKGEAQEFIRLLKKYFPDKKLYSSIPLNDVWKHICDKYEIAYQDEDDE